MSDKLVSFFNALPDAPTAEFLGEVPDGTYEVTIVDSSSVGEAAMRVHAVIAGGTYDGRTLSWSVGVSEEAKFHLARLWTAAGKLAGLKANAKLLLARDASAWRSLHGSKIRVERKWTDKPTGRYPEHKVMIG